VARGREEGCRPCVRWRWARVARVLSQTFKGPRSGVARSGAASDQRFFARRGRALMRPPEFSACAFFEGREANGGEIFHAKIGRKRCSEWAAVEALAPRMREEPPRRARRAAKSFSSARCAGGGGDRAGFGNPRGARKSLVGRGRENSTYAVSGSARPAFPRKVGRWCCFVKIHRRSGRRSRRARRKREAHGHSATTNGEWLKSVSWQRPEIREFLSTR